MGGRGSSSGKTSSGGAYIEAKTYDEVQALDKKLSSNTWRDVAMTSDEKDAVNLYTGSWHSYANGALRKGEYDTLSDDTKKSIADISKGIAKYQLKDNVTVFRGATSKMFKDAGGLTVSNMKDWIGAEITDKGFMSTSINKDKAYAFADNVVFKIKVPKGSQAAYVANNSKFNHEKEMLIDRNSTIKINGIKRENGQFLIDAELVKKK